MAMAPDTDEQLALELQALEMSKALQTSIKPMRSIPPEYICPVCRHLLTSPLQTPCGHLLCSSCLDRLLEEHGDPVACPQKEIDCDWLSRKQGTVFLDKHIEREIEKLRNGNTKDTEISFLDEAYLDMALEELNVDCRDSSFVAGQDRQNNQRAARVNKADQEDCSPEPAVLMSAMGGARSKHKGRQSDGRI